LFFQAEDGIRDWSVTGVQTCALPIAHRSQDVRAGDAVSGARLPVGSRIGPAFDGEAASGAAAAERNMRDGAHRHDAGDSADALVEVVAEARMSRRPVVEILLRQRHL